MDNRSYFDGKLIQYVGYSILSWIITTITLGLGFPIAYCIMQEWKVKHTVVEGKRLVFRGKALDLFLQWIIWIFLCIITCGIYSFWLGIAMEEWKAKNTYFAN